MQSKIIPPLASSAGNELMPRQKNHALVASLTGNQVMETSVFAGSIAYAGASRTKQTVRTGACDFGAKSPRARLRLEGHIYSHFPELHLGGGRHWGSTGLNGACSVWLRGDLGCAPILLLMIIGALLRRCGPFSLTEIIPLKSQEQYNTQHRSASALFP